MATALLVGLGEVGARAARQLADTPGIDRCLLADRDEGRRDAVASALGDDAQVVAFQPGDPIPAGVDVVACALPAGVHHTVGAAAIDAGVPMASADDAHESIEHLQALAPNARSAGVTVAVGCGLAPGLADVLVRHAADLFERVEEIAVARSGWAGPACVATTRHELRALVRSRRDGSWHEERPHGDALVWFPDPIGGRGCRLVTGGSVLLAEAFPDVPRISVQLGEPPRRTRFRRRFGDDGEWGAARVDVWGYRDGSLGCVVYGVVERTAVASGAVLAVAAAGLAAAAGPPLRAPGVHGLAELAPPGAFLAELAGRGVRAAVFEGVAAG